MQNNPAQAVIFLENAVASEPANALAWLYLGVVYEQLERYDEAIATYRRVLPIAGSFSANVANNLGNVYFSRGNNELAEQFYTQAIGFDAVYSRAYLGRANTRIRAGNLQSAVVDYEQYLILDPRSPQRSEIEQLVFILRTEFAAEERRRILAEEEERRLAEERQRILDSVSASLQSAADSSQGISSGVDRMETYIGEFELD
jgi:tetratricopeptide (TPR) repeat protein